MSGRAQRVPESLGREGLSRGTPCHSSTCSSSPPFFGSQGQQILVPQGWARSSPHSTKKGWLLPRPVPRCGGGRCRDDPASHCSWVQVGSWQVEHLRHRTTLPSQASAHQHPQGCSAQQRLFRVERPTAVTCPPKWSTLPGAVRDIPLLGAHGVFPDTASAWLDVSLPHSPPTSLCSYLCSAAMSCSPR